MTRAFYTIEPFDTTAFRDGRPFEQDDQGLAETVSVFPPPPPAIAGAVMVALAQAIGVAAGEEWDKRAAAFKGSNDEAERRRGCDLAAILEAGIAGPFIARWDGGDNWKFLSCCPADLLFAPADDKPIAPIGYIRPSPSNHKIRANIAGANCEALKLERLIDDHAISADQEIEAAAKHFTMIDAIDQYLRNGTMPLRGAFVSIAAISETEARIGIEVEKGKGTAKASRLYAAEHLRLNSADTAPSVDSSEFYFYYAAEGPKLASLDGKTIDCIVPFGGEGRFARVRGPLDKGPQLGRSVSGAVARLDDKHVGVRITALTPIPVAEGKSWGLDLASAPSLARAEIMGAVHDRPQSMGFIQRADHKKGKMQVIRVFRAGSTWFLKVDAEPGAEKRVIEAIVTAADGERLATPDLAGYGFGRFLAGKF